MYDAYDANEQAVARRLVRALLAKGFSLTVYNGGDEAEIIRSTVFKDVVDAIGEADQDHIVVSDGLTVAGSIDLVWGNSPDELVADYGWRNPEFEAFMNGFTGH